MTFEDVFEGIRAKIVGSVKKFEMYITDRDDYGMTYERHNEDGFSHKIVEFSMRPWYDKSTILVQVLHAAYIAIDIDFDDEDLPVVHTKRCMNDKVWHYELPHPIYPGGGIEMPEDFCKPVIAALRIALKKCNYDEGHHEIFPTWS